MILDYTTAILLQHSTPTPGLQRPPEASGRRCSARLEAFGVKILDGKEVRAVGWTTLRKTKERGQARLPDHELIKSSVFSLVEEAF